MNENPCSNQEIKHGFKLENRLMISPGFCLQPMLPFCLDIQCKKSKFGWNKVKYARLTVTHVCFIALTLAGSLGRCLSTRPVGLLFKQLPQNPANVNA